MTILTSNRESNFFISSPKWVLKLLLNKLSSFKCDNLRTNSSHGMLILYDVVQPMATVHFPWISIVSRFRKEEMHEFYPFLLTTFEIMATCNGLVVCDLQLLELYLAQFLWRQQWVRKAQGFLLKNSCNHTVFFRTQPALRQCTYRHSSSISNLRLIVLQKEKYLYLIAPPEFKHSSKLVN